jgi:hypothetical protein
LPPQANLKPVGFALVGGVRLQMDASRAVISLRTAIVAALS